MQRELYLFLKGNPMTIPLDEFKCIQCQACCRQPGHVRLKPGEPDKISAFLGMGIYEFTDKYTEVTKDRQTLSLVEQQDGACIFLTGKGCLINPAKPVQCREFPHSWKFSGFEQTCGWAKKQKG